MEALSDNSIVTVDGFCKENPAWTSSSMRWIRFNAGQNGSEAAGVWVKQGRRVLVHKPNFFKWLLNNQRAA